MAQVIYQQPQFVSSAAALEAAARARGSIQDAINSVGRGFSTFGDRLANISKQQLEGVRLGMEANNSLANAIATDRAFEAGEVHKNLADRLAQEEAALAAEKFKIEQAKEFRDKQDWLLNRTLMQQEGLLVPSGGGTVGSSPASTELAPPPTDKQSNNTDGLYLVEEEKTAKANQSTIESLKTTLNNNLEDKNDYLEARKGLEERIQANKRALDKLARTAYDYSFAGRPANNTEIARLKRAISQDQVELSTLNDLISKHDGVIKSTQEQLGSLTLTPEERAKRVGIRAADSVTKASGQGEEALSEAIANAMGVSVVNPALAQQLYDMLNNSGTFKVPPKVLRAWQNRVNFNTIDQAGKRNVAADSELEATSKTYLDTLATASEARKKELDAYKKDFASKELDGNTALLENLDKNANTSISTIYRNYYGSKGFKLDNSAFGEQEGHFTQAVNTLVASCAAKGKAITQGQAATALLEATGGNGAYFKTINEYSASIEKAERYIDAFNAFKADPLVVEKQKQYNTIEEARKVIPDLVTAASTPSGKMVSNNGKNTFAFDYENSRRNKMAKEQLKKYFFLAAMLQ